MRCRGCHPRLVTALSYAGLMTKRDAAAQPSEAPFVFRLVPVDHTASFDVHDWLAVQHRLLHLQPATRVRLVGNPPVAIEVHGVPARFPEVAPGLVAWVSERVGTPLRVESI